MFNLKSIVRPILLAAFIFGQCDCSKAHDNSLSEKIKSAQVMICSILKNEDLYIDEWLEYHRYLGFDRVQLYDNAINASSHIASLPEKYGSFVNVTHFPGLGKQVTAYRDCVAKNKDHNMWAAFMDIDEFVVLRKHPNIKSFLQDVAPLGGSVALGWSIVGANNSMHHMPGPVVVRFVLTSVVPDRHVKTIAYLDHVLDPDIHNTHILPGYPSVNQHGRQINCKSPYVYNNTREVAYMNHYYTKSLEEFTLKRQRGWASSYRRNHLVQGDGEEQHARIVGDFNVHNKHTNVLLDTTARDFYIKHHTNGTANSTLM